MGHCNLCDENIEDSHLMSHIENVHPEQGKFEKWPDGEYVIIDETLEPGDFND